MTKKQVFEKTNSSKRVLELLSTLSYRAEALDSYLEEIAVGVSRLLNLDCSVVTYCWEDREKIMASSVNLIQAGQVYSLHGTLTKTVVSTGKTLRVEDTTIETKYGQAPLGYRSYLGVPLRTPQSKTIGTICSFCERPRIFTNEELNTVELFAERAAIAIDNYNLYQQQRDFNEALEAEVTLRTNELKAAQARLIEKEKLAAIGQFASTIVHEIRNPLTTIVMGLQAMAKLDLQRRDRNRLSLALEESDRLHLLLKEILLYAKPQKLQLVEINLEQFLREIILALAEMPVAKNKQIQLICSQANLKIKADRSKIKQVIINLIQNALEASPIEKTVTCKVNLEAKSSLTIISIHNWGLPIDRELLPLLCEPFVSNKSGGTGLGLAIVKQIVKAHRGNLSIESNTVAGTTISFTIPG